MCPRQKPTTSIVADNMDQAEIKMATAPNFSAGSQQQFTPPEQNEAMDLSKKSDEAVRSMDLDVEPTYYGDVDGSNIGPYGSCYPPEWSDFTYSPPSSPPQQSTVGTQTRPPPTETSFRAKDGGQRRTHPYAPPASASRDVDERRNFLSNHISGGSYAEPTELRGRDLSSDSAPAFTQYRNNSWPPTRGTTQRRIPPAQVTGKYLNFHRELNTTQNNENHRLLYIREFNGKPFVGIRNCAPYSDYPLTFKQDIKNLKQSGVFLNREAWEALCQPETAAFVECATAEAIDSTLLYCAQWHDYSGYNRDTVRDSYNPSNKTYEINLAGNKWLGVTMQKEEPYIVFSEKYFSAKHNKVFTPKIIHSPMHVWEEIKRSMSDATAFLDQIG
jgi:hypothetical protein